MSTFDEREKAFEAKAVHDEELKFKIHARTSKLIGLWAAEKLGRTGQEADDYAKTVVVADLEEAGHDDVVRKIKADFDAANVQQSEHQIERTWTELWSQATDQVKKGE